MKEDDQIEPDKLFFDNFSLKDKDDFESLDFTQKDNSDPQGINRFIHCNPIKYIQFHISTIYSVKYEGRPIAYFTLSMGVIKTAELLPEDIKYEIEFSYYPALLLGHMGVDKNFWGRGVGNSILMHCLGLAQKINDDIACSALMLHTNRNTAGYYQKKGFKNIEPEKSKELVIMYKVI